MDEAGNTSAAATFQVNIDKVAPVISASAKKLGDNTNYTADTWTNQSVMVTFSCTDAGGSGVDSFTSPITFSTDSATHQADGTCTDKAGNSDSTSFGPIKIDKTLPTLNISGAADGTTFNLCGAAPARPSFSPSDALSGLDGSQGDSWTVPSSASGVGTYTYNAHAKDMAGNSSSETRTYKLLYGTAIGNFLQPINMDGSSRFKLGSTVPVKFQALCGGTPVSNVVARLNVKQSDGSPDPGVDEAISTAAATTGNLFRWTGSPDNQYIFNLSTKLGYSNPSGGTVNFSQGSWTFSILLDDGTFRSVNVQLVR
jgi:hypothetical protein